MVDCCGASVISELVVNECCNVQVVVLHASHNAAIDFLQFHKFSKLNAVEYWATQDAGTAVLLIDRSNRYDNAGHMRCTMAPPVGRSVGRSLVATRSSLVTCTKCTRRLLTLSTLMFSVKRRVFAMLPSIDLIK